MFTKKELILMALYPICFVLIGGSIAVLLFFFPPHKPKELNNIIIIDNILILEGDFKNNEIYDITLFKCFSKQKDKITIDKKTITKQSCIIKLYNNFIADTKYELLIRLSYNWYQTCEFQIQNNDGELKIKIINMKVYKY